MQTIAFRASLTAAGTVLGVLLLATPATARRGDCGQPVTDGATPTATDCLYILKAAVGLVPCDPACICAPGGSLPVTATDAFACLRLALNLVDVSCPCDLVTTTTLSNSNECPDAVTLTVQADTGMSCATNSDCVSGACEQSMSRCVTATELDIGWTGLMHDTDIADAQAFTLSLGCAAVSATCGACEITGLGFTDGTCRCSGDRRKTCDEPFASDQDDCGGDSCECYLGPPFPISAGNSPYCHVIHLEAPTTGIADIDSGALSMSLDVRSVIHVGETLFDPCPYCFGDAVAGDGSRDGTCILGESDGLPCDAGATHMTFPAPGGGALSLDCLPEPGKNVSGVGQALAFELTTGSTSLTAALDCSAFDVQATCHCGVCSVDGTLPCASNDDCTKQSAGVCRNSGLLSPWPNQCAGTGVCRLVSDGDGLCDEGPIDRFCDGILRANGRGLIACAADADCDAGVIGKTAGNCALAQTRECFLPTINAAGRADPVAPILAGIFCVGPSAKSSLNALAGLPGPARILMQGTLSRLSRQFFETETGTVKIRFQR